MHQRVLSLVRYKVDMNNSLPVSPNGVHVGTSMDAFSPTKVRLYSFGDSIYEIINYFPNNTYAYKYFNGNVSTTTETITGTCSVFGNRGLTLTKDTGHGNGLFQQLFGMCTSFSE
jgi:hypothetical protein